MPHPKREEIEKKLTEQRDGQHERLVQGESEMKEPTVEREQEIADGLPDGSEEQG